MVTSTSFKRCLLTEFHMGRRFNELSIPIVNHKHKRGGKGQRRPATGMAAALSLAQVEEELRAAEAYLSLCSGSAAAPSASSGREGGTGIAVAVEQTTGTLRIVHAPWELD